MAQNPVTYLQTISPDGKWAVAETPLRGEELNRAVIAFGVADGSAKRICQGLCVARWSLDGKWLYIGLLGGGAHSDTYRTFVIPLRPGETFPRLPAAGIKTEKDLAGLGGIKVVTTDSSWTQGILVRVQPPRAASKYLSHSGSVSLSRRRATVRILPHSPGYHQGENGSLSGPSEDEPPAGSFIAGLAIVSFYTLTGVQLALTRYRSSRS